MDWTDYFLNIAFFINVAVAFNNLYIVSMHIHNLDHSHAINMSIIVN